MRRERQEAGLLFDQGLRHGAGGIARHLPGVGHGVAPLDELPGEILDIPERAGGEERLAQGADRALDAALFPGRSYRAGAGDAGVMAAELEQPRVEADRVALALEDGALHVVV